MSYDQRCYDLAAVFLSDEPGFNALPQEARRRLAEQLAQGVQWEIDGHLEDFRNNGRFQADAPSAAGDGKEIK